MLHLDLLAAEAIVVLAKAWIDITNDHAHHAIGLIRSVMPLIEAQGSLLLCSEARFTMAECMLCTIQDVRELMEKRGPVLEMLRLSVEGYEAVECWRKAGDVYYFMAQIYNQLGCEDLRNEAALAMSAVEDPRSCSEEVVSTTVQSSEHKKHSPHVVKLDLDGL